MNSRIDHGLHQHKDVGWTTSRNGSTHIDKLFVVHKNGLSKCVQHSGHVVSFFGGQVGSTTPDSHALSNCRRGVGHTPNNLLHSRGHEFFQGRPGANAQKRGVVAEAVVVSRFGKLVPKGLVNVLRLDGHDNEICIVDHLSNRLRSLDLGITSFKALHGLGRDIVQGNLFFRLVPISNQRIDHGLRHFAGSNKGNLIEQGFRRTTGSFTVTVGRLG
mmetsp:Transcript_27143/g.47976  ORF Transcript_27143/g.47976 Transcript_27143/m.47976 type:complete len:216 (-) Transcript_27143:417-1064(-)